MKLEEVKNNPEIMSQLRWDLTPQTASIGDHGSYEITCQGDIDRINQMLAEKAGYYFYVDVWNCQAHLAIMRNKAEGSGTMHRIEDFDSPLLEKAVYQAGGMINLSGWYPLSKQLKTLLQNRLRTKNPANEMVHVPAAVHKAIPNLPKRMTRGELDRFEDAVNAENAEKKEEE